MDSDDYKRIYDKVQAHMGFGPNKMQFWFNVPNPMLGGISPMTMIKSGRALKLERWVDCCIDEAGDPKGVLKK